MSLSESIQTGLSMTRELQHRCESLGILEVLQELDKYIQFFETLPSSLNSQILYNHMRSCGFKKLYDEPHIYEEMSVRVPLEGILLKHLRDTLTVLDIHQSLQGLKKETVFQETVSLLQNLPRSSPCLDAYVTKLDRLVRVLQTPITDCSGNHLCLSLNSTDTDHAVAHKIFQTFLESSEHPTEEKFEQFVRHNCLLGNPVYKTVLIPNFQELLNLLIDIYQTQDFDCMVSAEK